jgi:hypothetical protein
MCKDNLKKTWQETIFESREAIVKLVSNQIKKTNKGLVENVIRPRATTLVLRLVAHFGIHCISCPDNCRAEMPSFCSLVFDDQKVGVIHACCKVITEHVCFLLEEQNRPTNESPLWLPRSLLVWVNDSTDKTKNSVGSVGLMPTITLAKPGIDQSESQSVCVSELLVSALENPDSFPSLHKSIEDHCNQILQHEQEKQEAKKQKKQKKQVEGLARDLIDDEAKPRAELDESDDDESGQSLSQGQSSAPVPGSQAPNLSNVSSPVNKGLKDDERIHQDSDRGMDQNCALTTAPAPLHQDGLLLGSVPQLSPSVHTFLKAQLSLNHGALPNALVNVVETGVQFMAQQRFGNYDPSLLINFNEPDKQAKRRKLNEEHMGHLCVLIEKWMTLHAKELDLQFRSENATDWKNATGEIINVVVKPRLACNPSELQCIGNELLGTAGKPTASSLGQKQKASLSNTKNLAAEHTDPTTPATSATKRGRAVSPGFSTPPGSAGSSSASKDHNDGTPSSAMQKQEAKVQQVARAGEKVEAVEDNNPDNSVKLVKPVKSLAASQRTPKLQPPAATTPTASDSTLKGVVPVYKQRFEKPKAKKNSPSQRGRKPHNDQKSVDKKS